MEISVISPISVLFFFRSMLENTKGFEIAFNLQAKILRLRGWGEWNTGLKEKYEMALQDKIIELSVHAHWQIWYVLVDFSRLVTPSEEIQEVIEHQLTAENALGVKKIACVQNNSTSHVPLPRKRDAPRYAVFSSSHEAVQWLLNE